MCQKCLDALDKFFPDATPEQKDFILWEKTAFPFASPETVYAQLEIASQEQGREEEE